MYNPVILRATWNSASFLSWVQSTALNMAQVPILEKDLFTEWILAALEKPFFK